jgi:hypothetical protein
MCSTRNLLALAVTLSGAHLGASLPEVGARGGAKVRVANKNLADLRGHALAGAAVVALQSNEQALRRNGRELQSFAESCSQLESAFEQTGFTCDCGSDALTCQIQSVCENNVCATVDMKLTYGNDKTSVQVCITYTSDPTGKYKDACVSMSFSSDMVTVESCSVQLEDASGALATCTTCEPCDGTGAVVSVDCSNIIPGAGTNGCFGANLSGGGSQELLGKLGESASASGATNGDTTAGGSGNTSSAAFRGSNGLLALGGFALALIM